MQWYANVFWVKSVVFVITGKNQKQDTNIDIGIQLQDKNWVIEDSAEFYGAMKIPKILALLCVPKVCFSADICSK